MTATPPFMIPETTKEKRLQRRRRCYFHRMHVFWVAGSLKAAAAVSFSLSLSLSSGRPPGAQRRLTVVEKLFILMDFPKRKRSF